MQQRGPVDDGVAFAPVNGMHRAVKQAQQASTLLVLAIGAQCHVDSERAPILMELQPWPPAACVAAYEDALYAQWPRSFSRHSAALG